MIKLLISANKLDRPLPSRVLVGGAIDAIALSPPHQISQLRECGPSDQSKKIATQLRPQRMGEHSEPSSHCTFLTRLGMEANSLEVGALEITACYKL